MSMWHQTHDYLAKIRRENQLTVDQQLQVALIQSLLTISQELSAIQDQGINPEWRARND